MRNKMQLVGVGVTILILLFSTMLHAADPAKREQELLKQLSSSGLSETEQITIWYNLVSVYTGYKPAQARIYAEKLNRSNHELAQQYGRISLAGITMNEGQYDSTETLLNQALDEFHSQFSTDAEMGSKIYNRFGHLKTVRSFPETAIKYYLEALKYSEQMDDYPQMCAVCTNISYLYGQVGATSQVKLDYAYKALKYAEKSKDPWALEQAYSTLGNTLQNADSTEEALKYQLKGLELSRQMKSEQKECFAALNIGANYLQLNRWDEAETYFMKALNLARKNNLKRPEAYILSCLADVYRGKKQYDQSELYVQEAMKIKDALSDTEQLDIYLAAINLSVVRGDLAAFEEQFEAYSAQQEKVKNLAVHEKMVELETQYETEKKEKQIAELIHNQRLILGIALVGLFALIAIVLALFFSARLANSRKALAEQRISQMEQEQKLLNTQAVLEGETTERTRLAKDLHDGLGGMLSVVKLNLNGMKNYSVLDSDNVEQFNKTVNMLDDSIKELRRIAHHMMPESLLRYGLKASLSDFCNAVPNVSFHYFGNEQRIDSNLEILTYRSIHELVNNALKHSHASQINVQIVQESDRLSITVQDNGKGFNPKIQTSGMGLKSISDRVSTFNGEMNIYAEPEKGTEINIEFNLKNEKS
ncbi:MAG TPA: tetratricopeptide repeat protein [Prolixibacteraceae bacterium]|nr:tetratricopeptide repeat protein [Prolixibacteraceae bacterium]